MSPEIDPNQFVVLTPQAQQEERFRSFLNKHTFTRICVRAYRDPKTKTVSFQIGVYGVDVATDEARRFDVPAYAPKAGQSVQDMIMLRAAEPNKWPQFFLNNRDRQNNNAMVCLRGVIGAYRTLYNIVDIEWYEDHLSAQLQNAYNESLESNANTEHILVKLLLSVWPGVVQQKAAPATKPAPTVDKALQQASDEVAPAQKEPPQKKSVRAPRVSNVKTA